MEQIQVLTNLSNYNLSDIECKVLNKGLKFGIFPDKLNLTSIQTEVEDFFSKFGLISWITNIALNLNLS